ncbi:YciI family protein [Cellulomonas sp. 179-A 4D5 NHS]|uniref:YciI family protein n=1 Tax=Cellulomonas sp. 179-A 4D5 NHS TaxID=3142378 RepID=UPI0039A25B2E
MQFVMLVRVDPEATPTADDNDPSTWVDVHVPRLGRRLEGNRLRDIEDATTVRVRNGRTLVADGPFAEYKELIAGYDLIEAESIDRAVEIAALHPVARFGSIEVREVWPF